MLTMNDEFENDDREFKEVHFNKDDFDSVIELDHDAWHFKEVEFNNDKPYYN